MDKRMMAITSRELHSHRTCYICYTKQESHPQDYDDDEDHVYFLKEKETFAMLFNYIRTELFTHPHIEPMVNLSQKLVANMNMKL